MKEKTKKDKPTPKYKPNKLTKKHTENYTNSYSRFRGLTQFWKDRIMKLRSKLKRTLNNCYN